ncbi:MAG: FAD-dependent thymidylate synthase [Candidatus Woesearchaeota archaeon]|jgi:thymidylate synthase (FAD)|nr:FAD-dependent thymidylate synthase [Candidatus Woesearchaeota archaeon]
MNVQLITKTVGIGKYSELNSEQIISAIARHGIIKEDEGKLVKYLMDSAHWSPLDMINFTFEIETSRDIGRQILRHQSIKFQEHSTRYSNRIKFEDIELRKEHPTNRQSSTDIFNPTINMNWIIDNSYNILASDAIKDFLNKVQSLYLELTSNGVAKECARHLLPGCLTTTMSANGTLRSWLAFLNVRCDNHAEKEIQIIANNIGEYLEIELPNVFSEIQWRNGMFM